MKLKNLYRVMGQKQFRWGEKERELHSAIWRVSTNQNKLSLPTNKGELEIDIQLSDKMIGAKLYEVQNDQLRVIAYIT